MELPSYSGRGLTPEARRRCFLRSTARWALFIPIPHTCMQALSALSFSRDARSRLFVPIPKNRNIVPLGKVTVTLHPRRRHKCLSVVGETVTRATHSKRLF
jgi:hypothetical protein